MNRNVNSIAATITLCQHFLVLLGDPLQPAGGAPRDITRRQWAYLASSSAPLLRGPTEKMPRQKVLMSVERWILENGHAHEWATQLLKAGFRIDNPAWKLPPSTRYAEQNNKGNRQQQDLLAKHPLIAISKDQTDKINQAENRAIFTKLTTDDHSYLPPAVCLVIATA